MTLSKTALCNLALSHVGVSLALSDVDTDTTSEAKACRVHYDAVVDEALRAAPWPFTTTFEDLALVEEAPTEEWGFSYRYPANCVRLRRLRSGAGRVDSSDSLVRYKLGRDETGRLIYADAEDATCEYTYRVTDPSQFDADFGTAVSFLLAHRIAPRVTGGDPAKLGQAAFAEYQRAISIAARNAYAEEQPDADGETDSIRARL